eukprot:1433088-Pleurochrysis_carterae.AAC.1
MSVQLKELAGVAAMEAESGDKALQMLTAANRPLRPFIVLINVHVSCTSAHRRFVFAHNLTNAYAATRQCVTTASSLSL